MALRLRFASVSGQLYNLHWYLCILKYTIQTRTPSVGVRGGATGLGREAVISFYFFNANWMVYLSMHQYQFRLYKLPGDRSEAEAEGHARSAAITNCMLYLLACVARDWKR